jgi:hypothetical protein
LQVFPVKPQGKFHDFRKVSFPLYASPNLHSCPLCKHFQGFRKRKPLALHHEGEDVSSTAATVAMKCLSFGRDIERRGFFSMEGTKSPEVLSNLAQGDVISDEFDDVKPFLDLPDGFILTHSDTSCLESSRGAGLPPSNPGLSVKLEPVSGGTLFD